MQILFLPFFLALAAPFICRWTGKLSGWILSLFPMLAAGYILMLLLESPQELHMYSIEWFPGFGLDFGIYADGLSLVFCFLILFIGSLIVLYTSYYLKGKKSGLLEALLFLFMGSMTGIVIAGNLIVLYVFWELTSICSFLMIGLEHKEAKARENAWQALLITSLGGLAMLAGFFLIYFTYGTYSIQELISAGPFPEESRFLIPAILLILTGAFTKSAQFPFHFWLPSAMVAPTPVSAYLHSATMVKAGVFLVMRLNPVFTSFLLWQNLLMIFGGFTMVFGAIVAVKKYDLKEILAYSTISSLGLFIFLTGMGTGKAYIAAVTYLLVHALYKAGLFMVAGIIDHSAHTRDIRNLKGLYWKMPGTAIAGILAALSYAGIPPALGYIGKELSYEATFYGQLFPGLTTSATFAANVCIIATAFMTGIAPFTGKISGKCTDIKHSPSPGFYSGPLILGLAGLLMGVFSHFTSETFIAPVAGFLSMKEVVPGLKLWHGFNIVFLTGVITIICGFLLWLGRDKFIKYFYSRIHLPDAESLYNKSLTAFLRLSEHITRSLQTGQIRHYIWWVLISLILLTGYAFLFFPATKYAAELGEIESYKGLICLVIFAAALTVIFSREALSALAALGVVGYGTALIFAFFGAPDLAMTQFVTETLSVLLFVLMVYKYPALTTIGGHPKRIRDLILSVATGLLITATVILVVLSSGQDRVSSFYLRNALPEAHGRNVVNVILVDFRALDTFGEITVLSVAALGVYSLIKINKKERLK